jgi:hypothetical protein
VFFALSAPTEVVEAAADSPADPSATMWEVAGVASYLTPPIHGAANPFGAGFGGRLGISFGHLYVGVTVIDYLGGTDVDLTTHAIVYGGEVGWQFRRSLGGTMALTLRPSFGLGAASVSYSTPATTTSSGTVDVVSNASGGSNTNTTTTVAFYMQPAATVALSSSWAFAALKPSALFAPSVSDGFGGSEAWLAWGLEFELGIRW